MTRVHSSEEGGKERESGKRREKKKGKKRERGERGFGELWVFLVFCLTVCFTPSLFAPFFNPPCHHTPSSRSHSPHHTPHHIMAHTTHNATTCVCCGVCCLRVAVFVCRCLPALFPLNPKSRHAIQSPNPPHMAPPMHEPISEWKRSSGACVDTTAQTPATTTKSRCHPHHLLSFLPSIGHSHSSQHHHANTHAM